MRRLVPDDGGAVFGRNDSLVGARDPDMTRALAVADFGTAGYPVCFRRGRKFAAREHLPTNRIDRPIVPFDDDQRRMGMVEALRRRLRCGQGSAAQRHARKSCDDSPHMILPLPQGKVSGIRRAGANQNPRRRATSKGSVAIG
jgi:hypothetical protein